MFILVPYGTDAAVPEKPWATWGLIAANVLIFLCSYPSPARVGALVAEFGHINPLEWFTAAFAHAGPFHLVGNMIFLHVFGTVVEGRLGWKRYLALYGFLVVATGFLEQLFMLGASSGGCLGASSVIFGLMTICLFWAPCNQVSIFFLCIFFFRVWVKTFEAALWLVAGGYLAWDLIGTAIGGFEMSTPLLHSLGALVGIAPALLLPRMGWVEEDGWDIATVVRHGGPEARRRKRMQAEAVARMQESCKDPNHPDNWFGKVHAGAR